MKLSDLPDGYPVSLDTETSGLFVDAGARISALSYAFRIPDKDGQWNPSQPMVHRAVPIDQGIVNLPLGEKELDAKVIKRLSRWPDWALDEDAKNWCVDWFNRIVECLSRKRLILHNAKFDLDKFRTGLRGKESETGIDLEDSFLWDTQLAQSVIEPQFGTSLKPTALRLHLGAELGVKEGMEDEEMLALKPWLGPRTGKNADPRYDLVPWSIMGPYAGMDAALTLLLAEYQWHLMGEELAFQKVHVDREFDLMKVLYRMEGRGVGFDLDTAFKMEALIDAEKQRVADELPFDPTPTKARNFFFGPEPEGLGHIVFSDKVTEKRGDPQVDDEVIERLVQEEWEGQDVAKTYQRHEALKSANSKWYGAWPYMAGSDGRLRTNHRQAVVVSGRLSVERIQLQAIPHPYQMPKVDGLVGVRDLFIEDEQCPCGCGQLEPWEFDVSQAEIRIATAVAQCRPMLEGFRRGDDSHSIATRLMFRDLFEQDGHAAKEEEHPHWEELRQVAKRAQPLDELVATPSGWKPMGEIEAGDLVLGSDGKPTKVVAVPYQGTDEVWEVRTRSGRVVRCCGDHLWTVRTGRGVMRTLPTRDLAKMVDKGTRDSTAYLPEAPVAQFDPVDLPIDPYLLGMLLGDGTQDALRLLGLAGSRGIDKHIPEVYMRGSKEQRYELLRGLMDTDGCATKDGKSNVFSSTSRQLIDAVVELVRSLGGTATVRPMHKSRRENNPHWAEAWFVSIRTPECPFALSRKVNRWKAPTQTYDRIDSVRPTGQEVAQQCITVDNEDGLYLTSGYAVTHNCNLGILYGAGVNTIQEQIKKFTGRSYPRSQVSGWISDWNDAFPQMGDRLYLMERRAVDFGFVKLINGRQRWFSPYEQLQIGRAHV